MWNAYVHRTLVTRDFAYPIDERKAPGECSCPLLMTEHIEHCHRPAFGGRSVVGMGRICR